MKWLLLLPIVIVLAVAGGAFWLHQIESAPATPLVLGPPLVVQGGQIRLSETGFVPEEPVDVSVVDLTKGNGVMLLRQVQANLQGNLDAVSVVLPESLASGSHEVETVGTISGRHSRTTLWIRAGAPWLTIGNGDLRPKAPISLIVGGFASGEDVQVIMKPAPTPKSKATAHPTAAPVTLGTLPTDRVGNSIYTTLKIPYREAGDYEVLAQGKVSHLQLKKAISLAPYQPTLDLSPWYGPPGLKIQLNARGYAPGESVGIFVGASSRPVVTVVADKYGNFWGAGNVVVPYGILAGPLDVRAVGADSGATTTRQFSVTNHKPWLELTTYSGAPSAPVLFSGGGWAAGEQISFHLGSPKNPAVAVGQADAYGWLHDAGPIYIPRDAGNEVVFVAVGEQSQSVATAKFKVVLPFGLRPGA